MKVTSIILAGGKNRRLGRNKALMTIGGRTMIERVIERLHPVSDKFIVVTSRQTPELPVAGIAKVVPDLYPGAGPLGGIYSGLDSSDTQLNIAVACDMPFLNTRLLSYMLDKAGSYDAVVPRINDNMIEPLHSIYSLSCLPAMKLSLNQNLLSIARFLHNMKVCYIEVDESKRYDPEMLSFFNINYPEDLDRAVVIEDTLMSSGHRNAV